MSMTLAAVNALPITDFHDAFGDVAEHAPWVATAASVDRPYADRETMVEAFAHAIDRAEEWEKLELLRAHPDLAGKAALAGDLTSESRSEQTGAGLDRLTPEQLRELTALNTRYWEKFGFPFILAVKGATFDAIVAALKSRVDNEPEAEFNTALSQVKRIVRFRLEERVA